MRKLKIPLEVLVEMPPWEWPEGTREMLLDVLRNDRSPDSELLLATELSGDYTVIDDEVAGELLAILRSSDKPEALRAQAASSLGPVLEGADLDGFDDPESLPITESTFGEIQTTLRELHGNEIVPSEVRRRVLEAAVRAPQDWHKAAIRAAYSGADDWKLTAVFCMRFVRGFDEQILEALQSDNPDIHYEAVVAAGTWEVDAAWDHVSDLVTSEGVDETLLVAAIHAVAGIRPNEAPSVLADLLDSDDEDIVEEVHEALGMAGIMAGLDDPDDDDLF
jgi:hypothetical protein